MSGGGELLQVTGLDRQQACRTNCENGLGMDTCYIIFDEHYGNEICDTIYSSLLHMKLEPNRMITVSGSIESLIWMSDFNQIINCFWKEWGFGETWADTSRCKHMIWKSSNNQHNTNNSRGHINHWKYIGIYTSSITNMEN